MWPPLGGPPTAALSCFLWSGCKLLPSKVTFALGPSVHPPPCAVVPTAGTEALEKDRAAATNGSWCPVAGGHACTHVPAPGQASAREDGPRQVRLRRVRPASPPWSVQRWGPPSASSRGRGTARSLWTATGWGPRRSLDEPSGTPRIGGEVLKAPLTRCPSSSLMCPALERPPRPEGMALGLLVPVPTSLRVPSAQSAGRDDPAPAMWSRRGTSAPQRAVGIARWPPAGQPTPGRPGAKLTRLGPPAVGRPDRRSSPQGPEPQRAAGVPCCREQAGPAAGAVSASAGSAAPAPGLPQSLENRSHVPSDPGAGPSSHRPH